MLIYHSSNSVESTYKILREGFDKKYIGSGYGSTFGRGIYFTPNFEYACTYNIDIKEIIKCEIDIYKYKCISYDMNTNTNNNIKKINKLLKSNPDILLVNKDKEIVEVVVYNIDIIRNIEVIEKNSM